MASGEACINNVYTCAACSAFPYDEEIGRRDDAGYEDARHEGQQVVATADLRTGLVNQELLLQNEYLAAESLVLRAHLPARLRLSDAERSTLAEIGKRLGRKALAGVARVAGRRPHGLVPKVDRDQVAGLDKSPF
jgi:hypothetical protein